LPVKITQLSQYQLDEELCRVEAKAGLYLGPSAEIKESLRNELTGSSATANGTSPRDALRKKLEKLKRS
jgi:hypothetical protein